jgi:prevent-host-death family protein
MAMTIVKIAELKDHLSKHLRAVEAGGEVTVTDRNRPIARIVPVAPTAPRAVLIPPKGDFAEVRDRERTGVDWRISSTDLLFEERQEGERLHR